jgi:hypothetical protein
MIDRKELRKYTFEKWAEGIFTSLKRVRTDIKGFQNVFLPEYKESINEQEEEESKDV